MTGHIQCCHFLVSCCMKKKFVHSLFYLFVSFIHSFNLIYVTQNESAWLILKSLSENSSKRKRRFRDQFSDSGQISPRLRGKKFIPFPYFSVILSILKHIRKIKSCTEKRLNDLKEAQEWMSTNLFLCYWLNEPIEILSTYEKGSGYQSPIRTLR